MKIGKLARQTSFSKDTIRYYEKIGLIPEPDRRASGYREFDESYVERLLFVKEFQKLGFTLSEIDTLLNMRFDENATTGEVKGFFEDKIEEVEEKIRNLSAIRDALTKASSRCEGGNKPVSECAILNFIDMKIFKEQE